MTGRESFNEINLIKSKPNDKKSDMCSENTGIQFALKIVTEVTHCDWSV